MKNENISTVISNIDTKYIMEADAYAGKRKNIDDKKVFFFKAPAAACLLICLLLGTGVYAAYEAFDWSSFLRFENGKQVTVIENASFKKIPESAPKTDDNASLEMDYRDVENVLGLNILSYSDVSSNEMYYKTSQNEDGSIGRVDLWCPEFLRESNQKYMTFSIAILNEDADEGYVAAFEEGLNAAGGKELKNVVQNKKLGTEMIVYTDGSYDNKICIAFVHDSIYYQFSGFEYTEEEMLDVIRQME